MRILKASATYFAIIFAFGFVLGTIRTLWGAQALGESAFVLLEVPVLLLASWLVARWQVRRRAIAGAREALSMGAIAFVLLMLAELALTAMMGRDPAAWIASLTHPPGLYGLLGQIAFGLMPWLVTPR